MSHLLVIELPGGNDTDILIEAIGGGHRVAFLTADPGHYLGQPPVAALLAQAGTMIDACSFALEAIVPQLEARHAADPFDAVLCLQDLRIVEAAHIARALGLRHLSPEAAALCRDKAAVRTRLAAAGITQPPFARARGSDELIAAADALGLPLVVKPADGFGSQNIFALRHPSDLAALRRAPQIIADAPGAYGLGVMAAGTMLVERLLEGQLIACDTMTAGGQHRLLGVNEKLFFPPPSFAIRGGCFTSNCGQFADIERCVFALLDAAGFDHGAAHVELMLTRDGPQLVEINPRLVGAGLARLMGAALGRSAHADIIALHAEGRLPPPTGAARHAVTRWLAAPRAGVLEAIVLPPVADAGFIGANLCAMPGDSVTPPYDNADRLGCVITRGDDRAASEALAEAIVGRTRVELARAA